MLNYKYMYNFILILKQADYSKTIILIKNFML